MATLGRAARVLGMAVALGIASGPVRAEVDVGAIRGQVMLAEEPAGATTLAAAKAGLGPTPAPVVIAGRIGGRGTDPFGRAEATFSLLEIPDDEHAKKPGHKPDDCPFCKKRAANSPIAAVSFVGPDGRVIPMDARRLFGLEEGQDVVVRGSAFFDPALGIPVIQVRGDGLHVRRAK